MKGDNFMKNTEKLEFYRSSNNTVMLKKCDPKS